MNMPARITPIDGMRGVLALAIVIVHYCQRWLPNGWIAVDCFFIISGFVLSHVYAAGIENGNIKLTTFSWRRLARLYPLYLANLLCFLGFYLLNTALHNPVPAYQSGAGYSFMLHLGFLADSPVSHEYSWNLTDWSVGIEFWAGLILFALLRLKRPSRTAQNVLFIGIAIAIYAYLAIAHGTLFLTNRNDYGVINLALLRGIGGLCLGQLAYRLYGAVGTVDFSPAQRAIINAITVGIILLLVIYMHCQMHDLLAFLMILLFAGGLPLLILAPVTAALFNHPLLQWLGKISYALYLTHSIFLWLQTLHILPDLPGARGLLILLIPNLGFAWLGHVMIERPGQRLMLRLAQQRHANAAPV